MEYQKKDLKMDLDQESLTIYIYREEQEHIPIVYWHIEEVEEDATVAFSMINAVRLFYENPQELLDRINTGYVLKD
jgi:rRNA processing protein Krr1/Pno1